MSMPPPPPVPPSSVPFPAPPPNMGTMTAGSGSGSGSGVGAVGVGVGGTYHPGFMFCGVCTDCQDPTPAAVDGRADENVGSIGDITSNKHHRNNNNNNNDQGEAKKHETYLDDSLNGDHNNSNNHHHHHQLDRYDNFHERQDDLLFNVSTDSFDNFDSRDIMSGTNGRRMDKRILQQMTLQLRQPLTNPSQKLVIQSLLRPLPGVHKVTILKRQDSGGVDGNDGSDKHHTDNKSDDDDAADDANDDEALTTTRTSAAAAAVSSGVNTIVVDHDASVHKEHIVSALTSAGHSVIVLLDDMNGNGITVPDETGTTRLQNPNATWVRSQFYVQGVCCASELPALRKIVHRHNLGPGVGKLNVNLTTKVVHVQHDVSTLSARDIAEALTKQGFPTQIQKDGATMAASQQYYASQTTTVGRTTLHIQGGLTNRRDASKIRAVLANMSDGVKRIGVNIGEGIVYVDHDTAVVSSQSLADRLTQGSKDDGSKTPTPRFPSTVAIAAERAAGDAAAAALDKIGRSRYVESTIRLEGLQAYQVPLLEQVLAKNFMRAQLRATYPSVLSETIKVEHDPKLASVDDLCSTLNDPIHNAAYASALTATVAIDGANANLYLPLQEDYRENQVHYEKEPSLMTIHANVWLSGIFWALSMVSYAEGKERFKYFGLLSVFFGLPPIAIKAWRTMKRCQFDANCMMVTASVGALALSEFDEAASVAFLFAVSEFLEARATMKARKALSEICALRPDHANVIHPVTKEIIVVPADRVPLGSLLSVRTGDKIAADGIIVDGSSAVDESSLTGEATPAHKKMGDEVSGGTINVGLTQLVVKTTTTVDDSAVSRLIRLVEEAQSNRSPTEKMIDVFARSYTPAVMFMAVLMCTVPWAWGTESGRYWTLNGLIIIVIACPCALTISTPVTYAAGLTATAQRGIIIKGGAKLEAMGSVDRIVFDKTGTLTKGHFSVIHLEVVGSSKSRKEMLELLTLMQERASHPIASSLVQAARDEGINTPRNIAISDHQILKGEGITAKLDGKQVYVGNERLFVRLGMMESLSLNYKELVQEWGTTGGTVGFIATHDYGIIGIFCVKDAVREEARSVIEALKEAHIDSLICTGDSEAAAQAVAEELGIPPGSVNSQLLPEDKLHFVGSLKRPQPRNCTICHEKRYVLFCGDGVNDAPALAVADIGVSMGEGAAMALEMSDVTLMDSRLSKLSYAVKMGQRVLRTVKENIIISLVAKVGVVALTFGGKMTLLYAIAADVGIMLVVTLNGMKLLPSNSHVDPTSFVEITDFKRKGKKISSNEYKNADFELVGSSSERGEGGAAFLASSPLGPSDELNNTAVEIV